MVILSKYISALRIKEVSLMTGFFIIGSFFSIDTLSTNNIVKLFLAIGASFFTVLAVYAYNAAAGKSKDNANRRLNKLRALSKKKYYLFMTISLLLTIIFSFCIGYIYIFLFLLIFAIWILYSRDDKGVKHKPFYGTLLHFFAEILHFNTCYSIFNPIDAYSISISIVLGFAFSIGHLNHEIIDYNADKENKINTLTVKYGPNKTIIAIILVLILSITTIFFVFLLDIFSVIELIAFTIPVITQLVLFINKRNEISEKALKIRKYYRVLYLVSISLLITYNFITLI